MLFSFLSGRRLWLALLFLSGGLLFGCQRTPAPTATAVKVPVSAGGVYRLTLEALQAGGLDVAALDRERLQLTEGGEAVPYRLEDGALIFYGRAPSSRYLASRPYILTSGEAGVPLAETEAAPAGVAQTAVRRTLHLEENYEYVSDAHSANGEGPWYWQTIQIQGKVTVDFELPPVSDGGGTLAIGLYGSTHNRAEDPDHSVAVLVNGQSLGTVTWDGQQAYTATLEIPAGTLQTGENQIVLDNVPEDYLDIMKLDWVRLQYGALPTAAGSDLLTFAGSEGAVTLEGFGDTPLILDVAEPAAPQILTGWQETGDGGTVGVADEMEIVAVGPDGFLAPEAITPVRESDWQDPGQQADLIILTTDALAPALAPLVEAREAQGLGVALVPVAEIYDAFGHGAASPESVNAFLTYAVAEWQAPAPRYLLLVGDATTDYRGYLAERPENPVSPPENVIPPYLVPVNFSGETVSDARLADVNGDLQPELAVGRWPADSVAAVESLVARTLAYEAGEASDGALLVADGTSSEFSRLSQRLVANSRLAAGEAEIMSGPSATEVADAWNEGAWLVTYTGHGSLKLWGKESIFSVESVSALSKDAPPPIVLQLTCLSGLFAHPEITSLAETMVAHEGGPVLTVAATSLTLSAHQEPFATAFVAALQDPALERVGDALQAAKLSLDVSNAGLQEISDTFGLIGDPSALIVRPDGE